MSQRLILNVRSCPVGASDHSVQYSAVAEIVEPVLGSTSIPLELPKNLKGCVGTGNSNTVSVTVHSHKASASGISSSTPETPWLIGTDDILTGVMMKIFQCITNSTNRNSSGVYNIVSCICNSKHGEFRYSS